MNPKKVSLDAKPVAGISVCTTNIQESDPDMAEIPSLWDRFYNKGLTRRVVDQQKPHTVFGVYSSYESDADGAYKVTAGLDVKKHGPALIGLETIEIEPGEYLVFEGRGRMPSAIYETWGRIWDYFGCNGRVNESSGLQRAYKTDFEEYRGDDQIAIYIGIKS